ncbi:reversion-inducing cysteine-rich protein with Kazal motifs-like [Centruroides vittatus]|uniref:reversion-inducing cysteine-rich protein with Kazal motifs-like n=1 Tax=Centruroides vittatus TaxID=120091 RepID=UPI00350FEC52
MEATVVMVCLAATLFRPVGAQVPRCCTLTTGSCRSACEQVSLVEVALDDEERSRTDDRLDLLCSKLLVAFWDCIRQTFQEIDGGREWNGRSCCRLPQSRKCRLACLSARNGEELLQHCRRSDELSFYSCVERLEAGDRCCGRAQSAACRLACRRALAHRGRPEPPARDAVLESCSSDSPEVLRCVREYTRRTPARDPRRIVHCCEKSSYYRCRSLCRRILGTGGSTQEAVMERLIGGGCGPPLPQDRLWQCFLANTARSEYDTVVGIDRLGMDNVKLQCCHRAVTLRCKDLCLKMYNNEWERHWEEFDRRCQYNLAEWKMLHCLAEVDEPCELGCEGLNYCSKFNYRPTELFRSCDVRADQAAYHDVELWKGGIIQIPRMPQIKIPVLDISECQPDKWKAIACMLQIKPCRNQPYPNMICKSDCINILSQCIDYSQLEEGQTPSTFCEILSPQWENSACISLGPYLVDSKHDGSATEVSHPCKPNPCNSTEVCLVNHDCKFGQICIPYKCTPGCRVGEMAQIIVPQNTYIQIPNIIQNQECRVVCKCKPYRIIDSCISVNCITEKDCINPEKKNNYYVDEKIAHNTEFYDDDKVCVCFSGEIKCLRQFKVMNKRIENVLPCKCPYHYIPVCGINGKTYISPCIARCIGLKDDQYEFGTCSSMDPCESNPCQKYQRCIPHKQFCLSIKHTGCKQYLCVNIRNCSKQANLTVCDTEGNEHSNLCFMLNAGKTLEYLGHCKKNCESKGMVCGHDGETYNSECAALANYVTVDYKGSCTATQFLSLKTSCNVSCQPLSSRHCNPLYLPESCCPVCGGAFQLLFSHNIYDEIIGAIKDEQQSRLSAVAKTLLEHVNVAECGVFVYSTQEANIVVLVSPTVQNATALQVEACTKEAEKLHSLFRQKSPTLLTKVPLSSFLTSVIVESLVTDGTDSRTLSSILVILVLSHQLFW